MAVGQFRCDMDGTYTDIEGATSASYMPVDGDANMYLRATAMYTDGEGSGKSEMAVTANMVLAAATGDPLLERYAGDDGVLQKGEVIMSHQRHYLDGVDGAPSRGDVITIIDLYLVTASLSVGVGSTERKPRLLQQLPVGESPRRAAEAAGVKGRRCLA